MKRIDFGAVAAGVLAIMALLAVSGGLGGCDTLSSVVSPLTGERAASATEIAAAAVKAEREAQAERDAEAERNAQRIRDAETEAQRRALEIIGSAQDAGTQADRALAELELTTRAKLDAINTDDAASAKRYQARIDRIGEDVSTALATIEARKAQAQGIISAITNNPIVAPALASVGVTPGQVNDTTGLLFGTGALAMYLQRRGRQRADESYDEARKVAKAEAEEKAKAEAAAWDEAKREAKFEQSALAQQQMLALLVQMASKTTGASEVPTVPSARN